MHVARPPKPRRRRHFDLIVRFGAGAMRGLEAQTELDGLHRGNRHHCASEAAVEFSIPRNVRAESHRNSVADDLADPAERIPFAFHRIDALDHPACRCWIERAQRGLIGYRIDVIGEWIRSLRIDAAQVHDVAADAHTELAEKDATDRSGRNACRGLAGGCALENVTSIGAVVLEHARQVGMARTRPCDDSLPRLGITLAQGGIHDLLPILPIAVGNEHRDWGANRRASSHAGQNLDSVLLDLHASAAAVALLPTREIDVDVLRGNRKAGGHALEDAHESWSVRFAGSGKA